MTTFLAILAAIIPTALYTLLIWWLDRYEKEPLPLLFAAFLWGSLPAVVLALVTGQVLAAPLASSPFGPGIGAGPLAALIEEPAKAIALLLLFLFARDEFDGPLDGIVYGALIGFGFAMSENLLYFLAYPDDLGSLFWVRSVLFGLNHALFTSIVGLALGWARLHPGRSAHALFGLALLAAIALHALHNIAVMQRLPGMTLAWVLQMAGVLTVFAVAALAWRHEAAWIRNELGAEITLGVIAPHDYVAIIAAPRRARAELRALLGGGWAHYRRVRRLYHQMTRLAFCNDRLRRGAPHATIAQRDELRRRIVALRAEIAGTPGEEDEPLVA
jgi:protease PrsW